MVKKPLTNKINTVIADNIDDITVNDLSMIVYYHNYYNQKDFIDTDFTDLCRKRINEILKDYNLKLFKLGNYNIDYVEVVKNA
jgi:hypothetical protein